MLELKGIDMEKQSLLPTLLFALFLSVFLIGGAFIMPWQSVHWGKVELSPSSTVTVTGLAESQQKSQVANYSAGVSAVNDDRETALSEVDQKVTAIIDAVKGFGIADEDIKTQNLNIYQSEEQYYEDGVSKQRPGQWRVSNTIEIKLRDVNRAQELASILTQSGATNIYGPNFTLDDTKEAEIALIDAAIANAREKAEKIAASSNRQLGVVIFVNEGTSQGVSPVFSRLESGGGGGGGGPIEPGTGTVSKSVTVTFELK